MLVTNLIGVSCIFSHDHLPLVSVGNVMICLSALLSNRHRTSWNYEMLAVYLVNLICLCVDYAR
jgi:hypothetical protein